VNTKELERKMINKLYSPKKGNTVFSPSLHIVKAEKFFLDMTMENVLLDFVLISNTMMIKDNIGNTLTMFVLVLVFLLHAKED